MAVRANDLRWAGQPGHYEVYYLTVTDPATGVGLWIRYTMLASVRSSGNQPSCALWFAVMDPRAESRRALARRQTFPIERLRARRDPFQLQLDEASLTDGGMSGGFDELRWDLHWEPAPAPYVPIDPLLGRLGLAKTVYLLPHAEVLVSGTVRIGSERIELTGAPGGQAHLWGSEHAASWAWAHCGDLSTAGGDPVRGAFFDGVSALVSRFGRTLGPSTPVLGCFDGRPVRSTAPWRILGNRSQFDVEGWRFEATAGARRLVGEVTPARDQLVGVTYEDPDGQPAYCYNSETASARIELRERSGRAWTTSRTLVSSGRCHFEFGTRVPVPGIELQVT